MDIISELQNNSLLEKLRNIQPEGFDLAVCFGFFHHIPTAAMRERAISNLCACVRPGGYAVLSFWQFMRDPKIAAKAKRATNTAGDTRHINLDAQDGDFFLGWQGDCETLRYCHDYSETEINKLVDLCGAQEIARFSADGKSGNLNRYVVLRIPDATQL
jgi:SAM-dependent methyltransferase